MRRRRPALFEVSRDTQMEERDGVIDARAREYAAPSSTSSSC